MGHLAAGCREKTLLLFEGSLGWSLLAQSPFRVSAFLEWVSHGCELKKI